ncbi:uncharacterized protein C8R40DRAFT_1169032 [Lentinula edodes]|uniref:uncharacterized protein n=1 Tax=Lentinula edodes TaxID=5353 RepID=UPI001E8D360E|nr:uncharacterized protein C8R40DRAFT_1169032 [Lentinula edodes]KAH7877105.1 hypothetical protein C8R40DRAFT_1169032 [Lentinula edodes]
MNPSCKRRSTSNMSIDTSQRSFTSDVSMQGSTSTIAGDSSMQIEETSESSVKFVPTGQKICIIPTLDIHPHDRQRVHALEILLAAKTSEVDTLNADMKSRGATIIAHKKEISKLQEDFKDSQQEFEDAQEQLKIENRGT